MKRIALLCFSLCLSQNDAFQAANIRLQTQNFSNVDISYKYAFRTSPSSSLKSSPNSEEYSREIRLREEAESPFRKVRFVLYLALAGGAATSLAVSIARILAALNGVNTDLMQESILNAGVDIAGLVVIGAFYKRDLEAQESRLKRASKGAEFAKLMIRGNFDEISDSKNSLVSLSSLRRGRGLEKRVVIAAAGKDRMKDVLEEAKDIASSLEFNDLVVIPVVLPQCSAPLGLEADLIEQKCVALPAGGNWVSVLSDESKTAQDQSIDVVSEGFCIVLKKNGRVGQRTKGINLSRMCGEVDDRRSMGMDVSNI